jgi:hypothetical protein
MPAPSRDKVRRYRERLRARGLRPITFWLPDTRSPAFRAEAERQSRLIAQSPEFSDDMDWIESVSVFDTEDRNAG